MEYRLKLNRLIIFIYYLIITKVWQELRKNWESKRINKTLKIFSAIALRLFPTNPTPLLVDLNILQQAFFLGVPHKCSIGLRSGDWAGQSSFWISLSSNHFCANLEVCLGSLSCWKMSSSSEMLTSSALESRWSSRIDTYYKAFILPTTSAKFPTPPYPKLPQTIMFPPPCLTVAWIVLSESNSPFFFQTHFLPSDQNLLILVSSDHKTLFQSYTVHSPYFKAKLSLSLLCFALRNGFSTLGAALRPWEWSAHLTVSEDTVQSRSSLINFAASTAASASPEVISGQWSSCSWQKAWEASQIWCFLCQFQAPAESYG